jgi:hypothetical protein
LCFSADILNWQSPARRPCECGSGDAGARELECGTRGRAWPVRGQLCAVLGCNMLAGFEMIGQGTDIGRI